MQRRAYFRTRRFLGLRPGARNTRFTANPEDPAILPGFRLCAISVVFAEQDVIAANVANLFAQGCDEVFVIDNESPDDTAARAAAAGATILPPLEMPFHDEAVRIRALNEAMAELSTERPDEHIWWLVVDGDEFPRGPAGLTIREYLLALDRRFRVVGSTHLNHYPTTAPAGMEGVHPIELQPCADREVYSYCELGHHKHPLVRHDPGAGPIPVGLGLHQPADEGVTWLEPEQGIITHHFQFRDETATRARMELMRARLQKRRPLAQRIECVDAVYAGEWPQVRLRRSRFGDRPVRPRPWTELVPAGDNLGRVAARADARRVRSTSRNDEPAADGSSSAAEAHEPSREVRISVLVEWDNAQRSNFHRPVEMLRRLREEGQSRGEPIELVIAHRGTLDPVAIKEATLESGIANDPLFEVRVLDGGHRHYYELKNLMAAEANGEILVFLDSDVWPRAGWLDSLLVEYDDPDTSVVAGQSFVGPLDSTFARVLATGWFFGIEQPGGPAVPVREFYANNISFRREVFEAHRYPEQPERFRGQCNQLALALRQSGITILQARDACVMHPPPDGWVDFLQRASLKGSDWNLNWRLGDRQKYLARGSRYIALNTAVSVRKVFRERKGLRLSPFETGYAVGVAVLYWATVFSAMLIDRVRPGFALRWI